MARKYVFADESGNFDFRPHQNFPGASRYFSVGTLMLPDDEAVNHLTSELLGLRRELAWRGAQVRPEGFHASEDAQRIRDVVFDLLERHPARFDVTLLEKSKAQPRLRVDDPTFYKYAWYYHFRHLAWRLRDGDELMVVAATIGTKKMRAAFRQAVTDVVTQCCPYKVKRSVQFADMAVDPCLQAADYGLWSVMRKWQGGDPRAFEQIKNKVFSEYDLFAPGRTHYYGPRRRETPPS